MSDGGARARDGIGELRSDHRSIEALLNELKSTRPTEPRARKKLRKQLVHELATHLDLEEQLVFAITEQEADAKEAVLKATEQHGILKERLNDLDSVEPQEETFGTKVEVLADLLHAHIMEEQRSILTPLRAALTRQQLLSLGERIRQGREALANPTDYLRAPEEIRARLQFSAGGFALAPRSRIAASPRPRRSAAITVPQDALRQGSPKHDTVLVPPG